MKLLTTLFALLISAASFAQCTTTTYPSTGCPGNTLTVVSCMDGVIPATITATASGYDIAFDPAGIDWTYVQGSAYVLDLDPTHRCATCPQYVAAMGECGSTQGLLKPSYTCSNNPKVYTLYPGATSYSLRLVVLISKSLNDATCTYTYHFRYHDFTVAAANSTPPPPPVNITPTKPGKGKNK